MVNAVNIVYWGGYIISNDILHQKRVILFEVFGFTRLICLDTIFFILFCLFGIFISQYII